MSKRQRDLRLHKYGISKYQYRELLNFCLQYPEWKFFLESQTDNVKASNINRGLDGGAVREQIGYKQYIYIETAVRVNKSTVPGNPEEDLAIRRADISERCRMIEESAREAGAEIYKWLLYAVTHEAVTHTDLMVRYNVPCGHRFFEECRRKFFFILSEKRGACKEHSQVL